MKQNVIQKYDKRQIRIKAMEFNKIDKIKDIFPLPEFWIFPD